ncbi:hypothetical protein RRG08_051621 [Elysia crispata]|uniref:Uncharacterized protein n=1 Tax=Elysia crispata TaxID=231223 RepID=A0AAE1A2I7_9GAST|nr:hypothetical protein RRG08_051621 [Elysia crispata]
MGLATRFHSNLRSCGRKFRNLTPVPRVQCTGKVRAGDRSHANTFGSNLRLRRCGACLLCHGHTSSCRDQQTGSWRLLAIVGVNIGDLTIWMTSCQYATTRQSFLYSDKLSIVLSPSFYAVVASEMFGYEISFLHKSQNKLEKTRFVLQRDILVFRMTP